MCVYVRDRALPQYKAVRRDDEERQRGRENVSDDERGLGFFYIFFLTWVGFG